MGRTLELYGSSRPAVPFTGSRGSNRGAALASCAVGARMRREACVPPVHDAPRSRPPPVSPLRRLVRHSAAHQRELVRGTSWSVLNKLFDLAPPLLIGAAVDVVVQREDSFLARTGIIDPWHQLLLLAAITVAIWVLESWFEFLQKVVWRNLAQTIQHELRLESYAHVQQLELEFFEDRQSGSLLSVLSEDVNQLERFLNGGANSLIQVATSIVAIAGVYAWLSPGVAAVAFLPMPFIVWGSLTYQRLLQARYTSVRESAGDLHADLAGNLGGIATIKSYVQEEREAQRIGAQSEHYRVQNRAAITLSSAFSPLIRMLVLAGFTATLLVGGKLALAGTLEAGAFSVLVFMTQRLLWPLTTLGETLDLYQRAVASTQRILDLIERPARIVSGPHRLAPRDVHGAVAFEGIRFRYAGQPWLFDGLDLTLEARRTTGIVGVTGAGKSSLTKLLLRFYEPEAGRVTLDGVDVRELALEDLRGAIGLVSQDVFLFHGTVRDNITYGRPDASLDEVRAAARIAELDDWVVSLPDGYDTLVGERGQRISGGQRQRISLARAVLKDPPVLVLDEATSSVDNETEAAIQRSLLRIAAGRTTLVIAHRLSTVRAADRIVVLEGGRVVEDGRHAELLARGGVYAQLWNTEAR
jgi:ATP-binding cassette subfamily B protein